MLDGIVSPVDNRWSAIYSSQGYDNATLWDGAPHINSVYPLYVLPVLTVSVVTHDHELICLVQTDTPKSDFNLPKHIIGNWLENGTLHLVYDDEEFEIPPLI